jgi:hypothetical protein
VRDRFRPLFAFNCYIVDTSTNKDSSLTPYLYLPP